VLELRDLVKHYPAVGGESVRAVDGVSLRVEPGEIVALYGPAARARRRCCSRSRRCSSGLVSAHAWASSDLAAYNVLLAPGATTSQVLAGLGRALGLGTGLAVQSAADRA
jgi:hypothetical protein